MVGNAASGVGGVGGVSPISDAVGVVASDTTSGGACTPVYMCVSLLRRRAYVSTITVRRRCSRMRSGGMLLSQGRGLFRFSHPLQQNGKLQQNVLLRVFQFQVFGR